MQGLVIDKPDPPFGLDMSPDQWLYLFTLVVGGLLFLLAWNIVRGRIGRAMMAIRDHALAAEAMGIDIALLKTRTFALSAMYTGVAGSLGAIVVQFVAPDSFGIFVSIYLFVGLVVGGVSSIGGAILGGLFIEFVPNLAETGVEGRARRGLWRDPDRGDVPDAGRRRGLHRLVICTLPSRHEIG